MKKVKVERKVNKISQQYENKLIKIRMKSKSREKKECMSIRLHLLTDVLGGGGL
jgi:hypothetical protein